MTAKNLIMKYLSSLSGRSKTAELVAEFVAEPGLAQHIAEIEAAFPGYELQAEQFVAEGDLVTVRAVFRGIHRGPFAGIEPTGEQVSAGLIIIYRVENDRIVDHWMQFDLFSLLQQLQGRGAAAVAS